MVTHRRFVLEFRGKQKPSVFEFHCRSWLVNCSAVANDCVPRRFSGNTIYLIVSFPAIAGRLQNARNGIWIAIKPFISFVSAGPNLASSEPSESISNGIEYDILYKNIIVEIFGKISQRMILIVVRYYQSSVIGGGEEACAPGASFKERQNFKIINIIRQQQNYKIIK